MNDDRRDEAGLDLMFQAARAAPRTIPDSLRDRLDADIDALAPPPAPARAPRRVRLFEWVATAGSLTAATAIGVMVGYTVEADLPLIGAEGYDLAAFITGADPSVFYMAEDTE